jgi:hypothetical protein
MAVAVGVGISLETECAHDMCRQFASPLFEQMASGRYDICSVLPIPASIGEWRDEHRTARKRADRCVRRGYTFGPVDRHLFSDDIHAINTSATHRQGRPMSSGYLQRSEFGPLPAYPCARHGIRDYGVLGPDGLVAYLFLYRAGELALVSQILGHADHLEREVMYLLVQGVIESESGIDPDGFVVYNRHDSGTDGLRFFKERLGFRETPVEWLP